MADHLNRASNPYIPANPANEPVGVGEDAHLRQQFERVAGLARLIGGDFGMEVVLGQFGQGNGFDEENLRITIDPELLIKNPAEIYFVTAREGGHRAISRGPRAIGLKQEVIDTLWSQTGFGFLLNCVEDPAVSRWVLTRYPGLEEDFHGAYQRLFSRGGDLLAGGAVGPLIQELGYEPRFARFGADLMHYLSTGKLPDQEDIEVSRTLESCRQACSHILEAIPAPYSADAEILQASRERFRITLEEIWPAMQTLMEADLKDREVKEMLEQSYSEQEESGEGEGQEGEGGGKDDNPLKNLSEELKEELEEKMREARESRQAHEETNQKAGKHLPLDELSPELKDALHKELEKMAEEQRKEMASRSQEDLRELEDRMNSELAPKLEKDRPDLHSEQEYNQKKAREREEKEELEDHEIKKVRSAVTDRIEGLLTDYDNTYKRVIPVIDDLQHNLERLFIPRSYPHWERNLPTGSRLNLQKAMQYGADRSLYDQLWERKSKPQVGDYAVSLLVDLSSSMQEQAGVKLKETFRALVALAEVLYRMQIPFEITGFNGYLYGNVKVYKRFEEPLDSESRHRISRMLYEAGGNTPLADATLFARQRLLKQAKRENFLITLTDGEANLAVEARKVIKEVCAGGEIKLIGVGLGADTQGVERLYPLSETVLKVIDLPEKLANLIDYVFSHPDAYALATGGSRKL